MYKLAAKLDAESYLDTVREIRSILADGLQAALPEADNEFRLTTETGAITLVQDKALKCFLFRWENESEVLELALLRVSSKALALALTSNPTHRTRSRIASLARTRSLDWKEPEEAVSWPSFQELCFAFRTEKAKSLSADEVIFLMSQVDSLRLERDELSSELSVLQTRLDTVSVQLTDTADEQEAAHFPDSLQDLEQWSSQYQDSLIVLPRALKGGKKSIYRDPELVYKGLHYLATDYAKYRRGQSSVSEHEYALSRCGSNLAGSTTPTVAGMQGEQYFVKYEGERLFLDQHLVRGGGNDQRFCSRIYFTWHAKSSKVVVGWLTSHLTNSLT